jgi:acetyltransferase-like isoleucine patch superfamily enzyme
MLFKILQIASFFIKPLFFLLNYSYKLGLHIRVFYFKLNGIKIGRNCAISPKASSGASMICIGDNVRISRWAMILTYETHYAGGPDLIWGKPSYGKVSIGNNVFIGAQSIIMPNVTIGDG